MTSNENSTGSTPRSAGSRADSRDKAPQEILQQILDRLEITHWDLLVVGDGSGNGWGQPCGWSSILIDRQTRGRRVFYGAMNAGSINLAESLPYLQALQWFDVVYGKQRLKTVGSLSVHIITDSQTVADWGTKAMQPDADPPKKCLTIWAAMKELRRKGYRCRFHWAPRMSTELNWAADVIAGLSRSQVKDALADTTYEDAAAKTAAALAQVQFCDPAGSHINIHEVNPDASHNT